MQIEVERKFLVATEAWQANTVRSLLLRDGLIASTGGRKVRVRIVGDAATLTVKGARSGCSREEFEYPIPLDEAEHLLSHHCEGLVVTKVRHFVLEDDFVFEVDVYEGLLHGVIIAEAELVEPDQSFPHPDWLGEEVTGREEYRKINLLRERLAQAAAAEGYAE